MFAPEEIRLLLVDDDPDLVETVKLHFEAEGYTIQTFLDAPPALRHVRACGLPHLALIDLELPTMHGFELSEKLKAVGDVPIIFITGNDASETAVAALARYAEDYVRKPFDTRELVARVRRVLGRISDFRYTASPQIRVDDRLTVDFGRNQLKVDGHVEVLTPTEATLLYVLLSNAGRVIPSDTLIARVWPDQQVFEDTLRVHMHRLRRKIEADPHRPQYIFTERGEGYRFGASGSSVPEQLGMRTTSPHR